MAATSSSSTRAQIALRILVVIAIASLAPDAAHAQGDPFTAAKAAANSAATGLKQLALALAGVGMVACLMLGFFNKLNWRWVATGIGCCFGISVAQPTVNWLASLAG